ncbi:hypothetical protein CUMW_282500 [Citrus unshiu]|uniref:Uncharacterized protein n=1 Tax=Citrus unshiu TaxID=55188 RepID=A0A2H5N2K3_CITUN|nr:hypothetical protein CUMW_282500 [Citrus unshiu]
MDKKKHTASELLLLLLIQRQALTVVGSKGHERHGCGKAVHGIKFWEFNESKPWNKPADSIGEAMAVTLNTDKLLLSKPSGSKSLKVGPHWLT